MAHVTKILEYKQLADHLFAVRIGCCDKHSHPHTMHASIINDPVRLAASLNEAHRIAAENHEAAESAEAKLQEMVGKEVTH